MLSKPPDARKALGSLRRGDFESKFILGTHALSVAFYHKPA